MADTTKDTTTKAPAVPGSPSTLRQLALLADGERGAIIGPQGDIDWLCVPRWHDEPVFGRLIGGSGEFVVTPVDTWAVPGGWYEPASLVWHSRWVTRDSVIECEEALARPAGPDHVVLLRRIRPLEGTARLRVLLAPVTGFDGTPVPLTSEGDMWSGSAGGLSVRASGMASASSTDEGGIELELEVAEGEHHDLVVELTRADLPDDVPDAQGCWEATRATWERIVPPLEHLHSKEEVRHSYAVLAGLTSAANGMVAAATMSLPERAKRGRNYDYRYAWIRDQCYTGQAVAALGHYPLLDCALDFVTDRILADGPDLKPAYTIDGGPVPDEHHVGLPGYPGGGDVVGNWVNDQFQLDSLGEALSLYASAVRVGAMQQRHWEAVHECVAIIEAKWREPDAGIWELEADLYTQSRLACVAGLTRIAQYVDPAASAPWAGLADTILTHTADTSVHPDGHWQQTPTQPRIDAALLRPAGQGVLGADDPRTVATLAAVLRDLNIDGYVYRFRQDGGPLGSAEGSFTLCAFLVAQAQLRIGDLPKAVHFFERARDACTNSGLFTEEYDTNQHQLRGNLPQAFVHAIFIETAALLDDALSDRDEPTNPQHEEKIG